MTLDQMESRTAGELYGQNSKLPNIKDSIASEDVKSKRFAGMSMADFAVEYLRMGFSIIPTHSFTRRPKKKTDNPKKPCLPSWTLFQKERASEKLVRYWFEKQYKGANIAVVCGEVSGLVGIDIDSPQALEVLRMNFELPDTIMQRTGREGGGWTAFFRYPIGENIGNSAGEVIEKVDVRGNGGYVIVPPSVHSETGKRYEWLHINPIEDGLADLLPLSEYGLLMRLCQKKKDVGTGVPKESNQVEVFEPVTSAPARGDPPWYVGYLEDGIVEPGRDNATTRLTEYFKALGHTESATLAILTSWNRAKNTPPLEDSEVKKCVKSIYKDVATGGYTEIDTQVISIADIASATIEDMPVIGGLLGEKESLIISADSGAGKSLLTIYLALALGDPPENGLWGLFDVPNTIKTLVVQSENSFNAFNIRLNKLFNAHPELKAGAKNVFTIKVGNDCRVAGSLRDASFQQFLVDKMLEIGAGNLILDPLISYHGTDENDNAEMRRSLDCLSVICDQTNATVILCHHYNRQKLTRGAASIRDWACNFLLMDVEKKTSESTTLKITHDKARNYETQPPFFLERTADLNFLRCAAPGKKAQIVDGVVNALMEIGGQVDSQNYLKDAVMVELNCGEYTARKAIKEALELRKIIIIPAEKKGLSHGYRVAETQ